MRRPCFSLLLFALVPACGDSVGNVLTSGDGGMTPMDGSASDGRSRTDGSQGSDCGLRDPPGPCEGSDGSASDSAAKDVQTQTDATSSNPDGGPFCPIACDPATHFCELSYGPSSDAGPMPFCLPFENNCSDGGTPPSCACANVCSFGSCTDHGGEVVVVCPFHP